MHTGASVKRFTPQVLPGTQGIELIQHHFLLLLISAAVDVRRSEPRGGAWPLQDAVHRRAASCPPGCLHRDAAS